MNLDSTSLLVGTAFMPRQKRHCSLKMLSRESLLNELQKNGLNKSKPIIIRNETFFCLFFAGAILVFFGREYQVGSFY